MAEFPFASCVPFSAGSALTGGGAERTGVLFRAAAHEAVPDDLLRQIETLLGLSLPDVLRYVDARHGQRRAARLVRTRGPDNEAHLEGFLLAGDTRAEAWIRTLLQDQLPAQRFGRQLLRPGSVAPVDVASRGKTVCTCFGVTESAIRETLASCNGTDKDRLAALQGALKCGTNCGSCLPELQRRVRANTTEAASAAS
jgi:assimilatory nitrate reductase catalytic subunit